MSFADPSYPHFRLILIVSFFILPVASAHWIKVLKELSWPLDLGLGGLLVVYVVAIAIMLWGASRSKREAAAREMILGYLYSKNFTMMSFDRINERIDSSYDKAFLRNLIESNPTVFRHAKIKGDKPGLARVDKEDEEEQAPN